MLQRHDNQFGVNLLDMKVERGKNQTYTFIEWTRSTDWFAGICLVKLYRCRVWLGENVVYYTSLKILPQYVLAPSVLYTKRVDRLW